MQTNTNLTSRTEGPQRVPSGALRGASVETGTAGHRTFPVSSFFTPGRLRTGISLSTDRADAGPTDKG